jgi:hypothetical protein
MPSRARSDFLNRIGAFANATQLPALISTSPNPLKDPARLLRNGLMIVGFAALEDFIRSRTAEVVSRVRGTITAFADLPKPFSDAVTKDVITAMPTALKQWERDSVALDMIQSTARALASTRRQPYSVASLGFYGDRSNIGLSDISDALKGFAIAGGWTNINDLARRCGLPGLSLETDYRNALEARNRAAHNPSANTAQGDLQGYVLPYLAIGLAYDALVSRSARLLEDGSMTRASGTITHSSIPIRFVDQVAAGWIEVPEGQPPVATGSSLSQVRTGARTRAAPNHDFVVIRRRALGQIAWESTDAG